MTKRGRKAVVSAIIDPLLFEGNKTVSEIADVVLDSLTGTTRKDGTAFTRNGIINNIRQRMFVLPRYGYTLIKDGRKAVRFVKPLEGAQTRSSVETVQRHSDKNILR